MGSKGKWHVGLEEGATSCRAGVPEALRSWICFWDFTSQDELSPGMRKGEQWGVNGNYPFPLLTRLNGSPANKNPREDVDLSSLVQT